MESSSSWHSLALVAIGVGPADLPASAVCSEHSSFPDPRARDPERLNPIDSGILWQIRAPRIVLGGIVGATLALSGASYQGVFQNALADPYLLGVASGAGLGATIAIAVAHVGLGATVGLLPLAAFAGAVVCRLGHLRFARKRAVQAPQHPEPAARRCRDRLVPHRDPDLRATTLGADLAAGLRLDPRWAGDRLVGTGGAGHPLRRQ